MQSAYSTARTDLASEAVCISHNANASEKGIHLIIFPLAKGKLKSKLELFDFVIATVSKENFEFKPVKFRLKIDLVSHPALMEVGK